MVVHHHRFYFLHHPKNPKTHESIMLYCANGNKKQKPRHFHLILLFFLFSSSFASFFFFFTSCSFFPLPCTFRFMFKTQEINNISCDKSAFRTDVCYMRGEVRAHSNSSTIFLSPTSCISNGSASEEKIRPYPRKWETNIMSTIQELRLKVDPRNDLLCDVRHDVPAVFFSTGGYTGNVFHEFNEGMIPLYITSQHFNRNVVFVVSQHKNWWVTKYGDVLSRLSKFHPIDFLNDPRTHCFPEAIVGLNIHGDLSIDPGKMANGKSIGDFRRLLDDAYRPRIRSLEAEGNGEQTGISPAKPRLAIVSRNGSRVIENEDELVNLAEEVGFSVEILRPDRTMELAKMYRALNSSDAMVGVHGAAMAHLLFMRPASVFIQIVPLGTDWAAETFYGEPAVKLGLRYMGYKILPGESSLRREYEENDPVLRDPNGVNAKGWEETKRVYLDVQNVRLDLGRFRKRLERAYWYSISRRRSSNWKRARAA